MSALIAATDLTRVSGRGDSLVQPCEIVSVFGIVNTLALSVCERTREIGMLRAIGASRRQLRRMIRWESVIGGRLAAGLEIAPAWIVSLGLSSSGIVFAPARRAGRPNVLEALRYE